MKKPIPYGKQFIDKYDQKSVLSSLNNDLITTGPLVKQFENQLSKYLKSKFTYVCSSGTAAIHLAMMSIDLKKNDIILMPAINFIASYNLAINMQLKIYLIDVDQYTGQITPETVLKCIKKNNLKKIKALIVMYHGGYPQNSKGFQDLKKKYNFSIIEDACHALGAEYKYQGKLYKIGSCKHSDISTFSLHPVKTITTGEGGIITTNNVKISNNIRLLRSHGILRSKKNYWQYDVLKHGFNYRLSDINCALGISQLKKIDFFLKKRKNLYNKYKKYLENFNDNLSIPKYSNDIKSSYHLFLINILFENFNKNKDHFLKYLNKNNILGQYHYIPIYKFSSYKGKIFNYPNSEKYYSNTISIPIHVALTYTEQIKIIKTIKQYLKKYSK